MKEIKINVNDFVKVKLREPGFEILKIYYGGEIPDFFEKDYGLGDGFYKFQLHTLMNIFGDVMYNGNMDMPFETDIFFIQ